SRNPATGAVGQPKSCVRDTLLGPKPPRPRGTNLDLEQPRLLRARQEGQSRRDALCRNHNIKRQGKYGVPPQMLGSSESYTKEPSPGTIADAIKLVHLSVPGR